jgi:hypothetical protein
MTRHLIACLAAALVLVPAAALAHPGHGAPDPHIHWEFVALGLVGLAATALVAVRLIRSRRR